MKINRMIVTVIGLLFLLGMTVNATETAVPTLISTNTTIELRGEYLSYLEGQLEVKTESETVLIKVNHTQEVEEVASISGRTLGEQLTNLPEGTLLDMEVIEGELGYSLIVIKAAHLRMDSPQPVLISEPVLYNQSFNDFEVRFMNEVISFDTKPQVVDQKVMLPLRFIAETLGYEVIWNAETRSVDLVKGPHFTSVYINKNSYFKNKMAPSELSIAPTIVDGRTLVPVEFITEILGYGIEFKDGSMKIFDEPFTTLTGYISDIKPLDSYTMVTVAPRLADDVEMWETTILIVSDETIINRDPLKVGELINCVHLPVMTMSIPGQTGAVIIY